MCRSSLGTTRWVAGIVAGMNAQFDRTALRDVILGLTVGGPGRIMAKARDKNLIWRLCDAVGMSLLGFVLLQVLYGLLGECAYAGQKAVVSAEGEVVSIGSVYESEQRKYLVLKAVEKKGVCVRKKYALGEVGTSGEAIVSAIADGVGVTQVGFILDGGCDKSEYVTLYGISQEDAIAVFNRFSSQFLRKKSIDGLAKDEEDVAACVASGRFEGFSMLSSESAADGDGIVFFARIAGCRSPSGGEYQVFFPSGNDKISITESGNLIDTHD